VGGPAASCLHPSPWTDEKIKLGSHQPSWRPISTNTRIWQPAKTARIKTVDVNPAYKHSLQQGIPGCRSEDLKYFAWRLRIFCKPLYILPPTENFFVWCFAFWFDPINRVARSLVFYVRSRISTPFSRLPEGSRPGNQISRIWLGRYAEFESSANRNFRPIVFSGVINRKHLCSQHSGQSAAAAAARCNAKQKNHCTTYLHVLTWFKLKAFLLSVSIMSHRKTCNHCVIHKVSQIVETWDTQVTLWYIKTSCQLTV